MTSLASTPSITPNPESAESPRTIWGDAWRRIVGQRSAIISLAIVALYFFVGMFSFTSFVEKKCELEISESYEAPSLHRGFNGLLGTDIQGRPVIWRILYGTRIALTITVWASAISLGVGVSLGLFAGYFGGWIDEIITWLYTTVSSVPWILLVLALVFVLKKERYASGQTGGLSELSIIIIALGVTDWVTICRLIRGEVIKHRDRDYVQAARAMGVPTWRVLIRHILPNVFHLVIITFSLGAVSYVQAEVALAFLGLGISSRPSWGRMIDDAKLELLKGVWWQAVAATVAIAILCLALNILGDALRDALDPRLRGVD